MDSLCTGLIENEIVHLGAISILALIGIWLTILNYYQGKIIDELKNGR